MALVVDQNNKINFIKFKYTSDNDENNPLNYDDPLPKVEIVKEIGSYD